MQWSWLDEDEATARPGVVATAVGRLLLLCCCWAAVEVADVEMCVPSTEGGAIRSPPTLIPTVFTAFKFTQTLFIQDHASKLWFSHLLLYFWETVTEFYIVCLNSFQSLITVSGVHCTEDLCQLKQPVQWSPGPGHLISVMPKPAARGCSGATAPRIERG